MANQSTQAGSGQAFKESSDWQRLALHVQASKVSPRDYDVLSFWWCLAAACPRTRLPQVSLRWLKPSHNSDDDRSMTIEDVAAN
jgi:hypothetical protein